MTTIKPSVFLRQIFMIFMAGTFFSACSPESGNLFQGYVEADYVYIAAPGSGRLDHLAVQRGDSVSRDQLLFALDPEPEKSRVAEEKGLLAKAEYQLDDLKKGQRPTEIAALAESLREAKSALRLARIEHARRKKLFESNTLSEAEYDAARTEYQQNRHRVKKIEAELKTAKLGARKDRIRAANAEVSRLKALLAQSSWQLHQKKQFSPEKAVVFDTLYRPGEWVPAGKPVVCLLPPENRKVRFYVPQETAGRLFVGQTVWVSWDGTAEPDEATIRFISPEVEYTPPVIYSSQSRKKLVIMVEAVPRISRAKAFHPGQPVDVRLPAGEAHE